MTKYFGNNKSFEEFIHESHEIILKEIEHVTNFQNQKEIEILSRCYDIIHQFNKISEYDE